MILYDRIAAHRWVYMRTYILIKKMLRVSDYAHMDTHIYRTHARARTRAHSLIKLILQKDSSRVTCHIMWENTNQHMIYCYTFKCLYQEPGISLNKLNQAVDILLIDISFISSLQHLK